MPRCGRAQSPEDYRQINEELTLYDERLSKLPQIVVANKADLPQAEKGIKELRQALGEENVCVISAVTGSGVKQVLYKAAEMLAQLPPAELPEKPVVLTPAEEEDKTIDITRENDIFIIRGKQIEKFVAMTDFDNEEAVKRFQRLFRLWGHEDALKSSRS